MLIDDITKKSGKSLYEVYLLADDTILAILSYESYAIISFWQKKKLIVINVWDVWHFKFCSDL